jgi:glycosyltransferase involved in cell wall biosynthesis
VKQAMLHQIVVDLRPGDGVGRTVLAVRDTLRAAGMASEIFVDYADQRLAAEVRPYRDYSDISAPGQWVLFHSATGSKVTPFVVGLPDRLALYHYGFTPAHFFEGLDLPHFRDLTLAEREAPALFRRADLVLAISDFIAGEAAALGAREVAVLPPPATVARARPSPTLRALFGDGTTNIFSLGRIAPNKRIEELIFAHQAYREAYDPRARLLLAGDYRCCEGYHRALLGLLAERHIGGVHFLGKVSESELEALFAVSAAYLCLSDHEGLCLPVVEALARSVPVVAKAAAALPETLGDAGLLLERPSPPEVAAALNRLLTDRTLRRQLAARAPDVLARYAPARFRADLLRLLAERMGFALDA